MAASKQVWEYDTLTETVYALIKNGRIDDIDRHLIIGAGIVLGSKGAHDLQQEKAKRKGMAEGKAEGKAKEEKRAKGYWANSIRDQAEEAGLIADKIKSLSADGMLSQECLDDIVALKETRVVKSPWTRPYGIIKTIQPYEQESLQRLGEYIEFRLTSNSNRQHLREFRQQATRLNENSPEHQRLKAQRLLQEKANLTGYLRELYGGKH